MFHPHDASHILHILLHDLRRAIVCGEAGSIYEDAEGMVWVRGEGLVAESRRIGRDARMLATEVFYEANQQSTSGTSPRDTSFVSVSEA
jgi:hypothetical protein